MRVERRRGVQCFVAHLKGEFQDEIIHQALHHRFFHHVAKSAIHHTVVASAKK